MSELDVVKAVLPDLRASLSAGPLHTNRSGPSSLEAEAARRRSAGLAPLEAYFLVSPGPTPSSPDVFDSAAQFFLEGWGPWALLDAAFAAVSWMEGHQVGRSGGAARIRYGKAGGTRPKEPEARLADGREMYHYTDTYRAAYVDLSRLSGPAVARARPP